MASQDTAFRALSDVILALASEHEVEPVLQRLGVQHAFGHSGHEEPAVGVAAQRTLLP